MAQAQLSRQTTPDETKDRSKSQASKENLLAGISPAQSGTQSANNDTAGSPPPKKTEKAIKLPANELTEKDFFKKYWIEAGKIGQKSDKKVFALKMIEKNGKFQSDIRVLQKEIYVLQR
ncbi:hypothetical protein RFI_05798, partial [Reticulomyxa filosa]